MGYCTYREYSGGAVAAWIGTGTDIGKQITWTFKKGATNKTAACNRVRDEFCKKYGVRGSCYDKALNYTVPKAPNCVKSLNDQAFWSLTYGKLIEICGGPTDKSTSTSTLTPAQQKAKDDAYNKTKKAICAKDCGLNPFCHSAKWQYNCGGDVTGIFGEKGLNACAGLPVPFNDCKNVIIFAVVGIAFLWMLKK